MSRLKEWIALVGPGILVAATGVGAGDLATGAITGNQLGTAILWAVIVGALFKYVMNEGLARWQLATGTTLVEGCIQKFGSLFTWIFLFYLVIWTFFVAAALMSACGIVMHAILPLFGSAALDKWYWGLAHSLVAIVLVWYGGFALFERVMTVCIGIMFVTVLITACMLAPPLPQLLSGLVWPSIPRLTADGLQWTIALLGGIGGTMTILCYGYWIRECNRTGPEEISRCRIDLGSGYVMTALFGIGMVIIGAAVPIEQGGSAKTIVNIAEKLQDVFGSAGLFAKWAFLLGAWGAVGSSLLGVWQSIPYLFADVVRQSFHKEASIQSPTLTSTWSYRGYLIAMGLLPMLAVSYDFKSLQKLYAIIGAMIIPLLAALLLYMGNRSSWIGARYRNPLWSNFILACALLFFIGSAVIELQKS